MPHPRVSVIIITFNQKDTIGRAIESVLAQEGETPFEIILADDASTDGTRAVCEEYAAAHPYIIRLLPPAPNKGMVRNYFDAMRRCRGEYVTDCAGDDYWTDPLKIDRLTALLDAHPEATVAYSDWTVRDTALGTTHRGSSRPSTLPLDGRVAPGPEVMARLMDHTAGLPYNLTASLLRREPVARMLETCPGHVCNPAWGCEDLPVMALLAAHGGAVGCPESTYTYNVTQGSVSVDTDSERQARFYLRVLRCHRDLGRIYSVAPEAMSRFFRAKADYTVAHALYSGDRRLCAEVAAEIRQWPLPLPPRTRLQLPLLTSPLLPLASRLRRLVRSIIPRRQG